MVDSREWFECDQWFLFTDSLIYLIKIGMEWFAMLMIPLLEWLFPSVWSCFWWSIYQTFMWLLMRRLRFGYSSYYNLAFLFSSWIHFLNLIYDRVVGEMKIGDRARSPGPCSRGPTSPTSPLHPRMSGSNVDSPSASQCHPLPLPPGSPTSPCALPTARTAGVAESSHGSLWKCKKGRLLGRGTFGQVYLGFR